MTAESEDQNSAGSGSEETMPQIVTNTVTDLVTGISIPKPISQNAIKAFGQLCSAAVDIPVAWLEGIAAEKRAETEARLKLITTSADKMVTQFEGNPDYARIAERKYAQRILREQVNLDRISEAAAEQLRHDATRPDSTQATGAAEKEINDDWLNHFETEARQKSTQEMQLLFGRILAGEIQRPSRFSIKAVKLLGELDKGTAAIFRRLCSLSVSLHIGGHLIDARVASLKGAAGSNSLQQYGLSFDQLNILQEHGLIIADYNSHMDYSMSIPNPKNQIGLPFMYQKKYWALDTSLDKSKRIELRLSGVALSRAGKELLPIVDIEPSEKYTTDLKQYFERKHLQMVPFTVSNE